MYDRTCKVSYNWTLTDEQRLRQMVEERVRTSLIARRLGRSPKAIRSKASQMGISLRAYGDSLNERYPDRGEARSLHKRRMVLVTKHFIVDDLLYSERIALARKLIQSVPEHYREGWTLRNSAEMVSVNRMLDEAYARVAEEMKQR